MGRLNDGAVECAYHGLKFDANGVCVRNPHGATIPRGACVRSYQVVEQDGGIWIWMGNSDDVPACPRYQTLSSDRYLVARDSLDLKANYLLAVDNILDLSHLQFLHPTTLGSNSVESGKIEVTQVGDEVRSVRVIRAERLSRMLEVAFQIPQGTPVDRTMDVRWTPPCSALVVMSVAPNAVAAERRALHTLNFFTPEGDSSCRYFFAISVAKDSKGYGQAAMELGLRALRVPFEREDKLMLEAQQQRIGNTDLLSLHPVMLTCDSASMRARAVVQRLSRMEGVP
jgi:vanillate O-demethylase monooxygenase subunit